jgi:hypothetical protein
MCYLIRILFIFVYSKTILAQEKKLIIAKVKLYSVPIYDVYITNTGKVFNHFEMYNIPLKIGSLLSLSHLNIKTYQLPLLKKHRFFNLVYCAVRKIKNIRNIYSRKTKRNF